MFIGNVSRGKRGASTYVPPPPPPPLDANDWTVVGAPVVTHGVGGATSVAAVMPVVSGGVLAGDAVLAFCSSRLQGTMVVPPAGNLWHRDKQSIHNNGGNGSDVGATMATFFWMEATGAMPGPITFDFPDPAEIPAATTINVLSVMLMVIRKGSLNPGSGPAYWDIQTVDAYHRNWNEAVNAPSAIVCKSINKINLKPKDQVLVFNSVNSDAFTFTPRAATFNAGLTVVTQTENLFGSGTTNGNDQYMFGSHFRITAGDITDYVTATATAVGTAALRAPWVTTHIVRVRMINTPMEYIPGAGDFINPADVVNNHGSQFDNHGGIWESMRIESEGIATYGIETYKGEPHFYIINNFQNYDFATFGERNRRGEVIRSTWQPRWFPGVKLFDSYRFKWEHMPALGDQFIMYQNHTGGFTGALGPNHPLIALEFCRANQYNNPNGYSGFAPEGSLILAMNADIGNNTNLSYYYVPGINYIGSNKDFPIEFMIKFGLAGSGRLILCSGGEVKWDITTRATIASDTEDVGDPGIPDSGSMAMVGGQSKFNTYLHQIPLTADPTAKMQQYYNAFVAIGATPQIKTYHKGFKRSIKHPNDFGYGDEYDFATLQKIIIQ